MFHESSQKLETEVLDDEQPLVVPISLSLNMVSEDRVFTCEEVGNCNMTFKVVTDDYVSYEIIPVGEWHVGCQLMYKFIIDILISRVKRRPKEGWDNEYSEAFTEKLFQVLSTCVIHLKEEIIEFPKSYDNFSFSLVKCCCDLLPNKVHYHFFLFDKDMMGLGVFPTWDELFLQRIGMFQSSTYFEQNTLNCSIIGQCRSALKVPGDLRSVLIIVFLVLGSTYIGFTESMYSSKVHIEKALMGGGVSGSLLLIASQEGASCAVIHLSAAEESIERKKTFQKGDMRVQICLNFSECKS
ncbi:hypothetical protein RND71_039902 [Anisodus tanguticus]|uniref:Uncharacterized protein n=1 Tax=Anisodus tanguticus TaxID=243964 RepID=A0AAE1QY21_9SOLA|nr:hypothetical protein RND71_039902 [Anisodus tanguticus]